jgi:hypothetical protein
VQLVLDAFMDPQKWSEQQDRYDLQKEAVLIFIRSNGNGARMSYRMLQQLKSLAGINRFDFMLEGALLPRTVDSSSVIGIVELLCPSHREIEESTETIRRWEQQGYFEVLP